MLNPFVPLAQPHFPISVLNSACGLALTFPLMEVDCPLALPANVYFIFPARAGHKALFCHPEQTEGGLLHCIGQVLSCR